MDKTLSPWEPHLLSFQPIYPTSLCHLSPPAPMTCTHLSVPISLPLLPLFLGLERPPYLSHTDLNLCQVSPVSTGFSKYLNPWPSLAFSEPLRHSRSHHALATYVLSAWFLCTRVYIVRMCMGTCYHQIRRYFPPLQGKLPAAGKCFFLPLSESRSVLCMWNSMSPTRNREISWQQTARWGSPWIR